MKKSNTKKISFWLFIFSLFMIGNYATAQSPNALHFDGADDYVTIADTDGLDMTENYTLECWIRLDGFAPMAGIISKYHSNNSNGYFLRMANFPDNSIEFDGMTTVPLINQGQWYHIAAVKNGNNRYLYLNGLSKTLSGTPISVQANTDPLTIGVDYLDLPRHFNGVIDEVRIWNVARTQEEIQQAMKATIDPSEPGLVAYYRMDQGTAGGNNAGLTQVIDATGSSHHGTAMNFAMNGNTSNWVTGSIPVNKLYVDVSATGAKTGSSWENAYTSLSAAMDFAKNHTEIDSILVAKGVYYPETIAGDGTTNRDKAFVLVPDVKLYGGFQPGGTGGWEARELPGAGNPWNGTVLNGDFNSDDEVTGSGITLSITGNTENAYHVVIAAGDVGDALMDGFIITGGYADGPTQGGVITVNGLFIKKAWGGGIYVRGASPVFTNMLVWGNSTRTDTGCGGGIYTEQQAAPLITFSNFHRNLGGQGGGIYNAAQSSPVYTDVVTDGNKAINGGGMYNGAAVVDLTKVTLNGNDALGGGGMYNVNGSSVTVKESVLSNNTSNNGGGIYNSASLSCTGTVFIGNTANYNGGAVYSTVYTQLTNTLLVQNTAVAGDGGAIYNNGGVLGLVLANVTVTGNTAAGGGGGIRNLNTGGNPITPQIDNSIIWGNQNASGIANVSNDLSIPKYSYCLIQGSGGSGGWVEEFGQDNGGNIDADPLFVNSDNPAGNDGIWGTVDDGLALSFCSPSVNAGSNTDIPEGTTTDITGNPRIYDGTVDMGAYELQSSAHPATVYVDATAGNDNNQGNSWNASFKTLSYALEVVKNSACYTGVDTILVAKGTYFPQQKAGNGTLDRDKSFVLLPNVKIYGGFQPGGAGGWDAREMPDPENLLAGSILNGDFSQNDDVTGSGGTLNITGNGENAYHVVISAGNVGTALLDGFSIKSGNADSEDEEPTGNIQVNGQQVPRHSGGGIINVGSSPAYNNIFIWGNYAYDYGGGICSRNSSSVITNSSIGRNMVYFAGAGMMNMENSPAAVSEVRIWGNRVTGSSGGGVDNVQSSATFTNVVIEGNAAYYSGGGMANANSSPVLTNVLIANNTAQYSNGGGINNYQSSPLLYNVTMANNRCGDGYAGGAMFNTESSNPQLFNSIIWGNTNTSGAASGIASWWSSIPVFSNNLIQDSGGSGSNWIGGLGTDNGGNIDTDPLFVNPDNPMGDDGIWGTADDGWALSFCSPSVNAGSNAAVPEGTTDITGNPRIYDGTVDMGAYELQSGALSTTVYVDVATGNDNNKGNSWNAPFQTLSHALEMVKNSACYTGVDTILIAKGVYYPETIAGDGTTNRDKAFVLLPDVKLYGGFQPGGTGGWEARELPDADNPWNGTVLSGDFNSDDEVTGSGATLSITGNTENAYHVVIAAGDVGNALMDGFIITGGYADGPGLGGVITVNGLSIKKAWGGGIYVRGASPVFTNMLVWGNSTRTDSGYGGGIFAEQQAAPLFTFSNIHRNLSGWGGGIYNAAQSSIVFTDVVTDGNKATYGGGMFNSGAVVDLTKVTLNGNDASDGGGMYSTNYSSVTLKESVLSNNTVSNNGGGIHNSASLSCTGTVFIGNTANYDGGAVYSIAYMWLTNTLLVQNTAGDGGAICNSAVLNLANVTITGNTAAGGGGGIRNQSTSGITPQIDNSIIWGNQNASGIANISNSLAVPGYSYCLIQGSGGSGGWDEGFGTDNGGNRDTDPLFANPDNPMGDDGIWRTADDGLFLQPGSPAINSGDPQTNTSGYPVQTGETDVTGAPRILESVIDMGAYESLSDDAVIWTVDDEWRNGVEPEESKDVFIQGNLAVGTDYEGFSAKTLTVQNGGKLAIESGNGISVTGKISNGASAEDFIVHNNANLIQIDDVENAGQITVQRDSRPMIRLDYTLWSPPVTGQNLFGFSPETVNGVTNYPGSTGRIYIYDGASGYVNPNPFDENAVMNPGTGYLFRSPNNFSSTVPAVYEGIFTGIPFNGSLSVSTNADEFTSIGNPYPSNLDADLFLAANPEVSTLYFWVNTPIEDGEYLGNNYATYTITGGTSNTGSTVPGEEDVPSGTIAAGQGFIVSTADNSVVFDNSMRTDLPADFFKTTNLERHRFWLNLYDENNNGLNQILIGYITGATNGMDNQIDGKLFGYEGSAIYSLIDDASAGSATKFTIQGRALPFETDDVVPLGFRATQSGKFKISLADFDGLFAEGQKIYLKDKELDLIHDLEVPYEFESEAGEFNSRFEIVYENDETMNVDDFTKDDIQIYKNMDFIEISSKSSKIGSVEIYDLSGRRLFTKSGINGHLYRTRPVAKGVLIVKVQTQDGEVETKKIMF